MFNVQNNPAEFGYATLPPNIIATYKNARGREILPVPASQFYAGAKPFPGTTLTKAGMSMNIRPEPLNPALVDVKYPQYGTNTGEPIEFKRMGRQVGAYDPYKDTPWQEWTSGIQYYTPYVGRNPKNIIPPTLVPHAASVDVWGNSLSETQGINRGRASDITESDMVYSCKSCSLPAASLGTPLPTVSPEGQLMGVYAPLPVQLPGQYPNIGEYTARYIGRNTGDWPPPQNPIVENVKRKYGVYTPPVIPEYGTRFASELHQGFDFV